MDAKFVKTQKGKDAVVVDGYKYCFERKNQDETAAYRCVKYWAANCKATVLMEGEKVVKKTQEHSHPPSSVEVTEEIFRNSLKERTRLEPHAPAPEIYKREMLSLVGRVDDDIIVSLPTFESVRSTIYREKRKQQPRLPREADDIELEGSCTQTADGRAFLLFDISTNAGRVLCFSTQETLTHFLEAEEVFIDGTLFSCPSLFYQLVTMSIVQHGVSFNIAYFLLPGKSREVYVTAFTEFKGAVTGVGSPLSLAVVRTDFEISLIQALLVVFPGIRHRGCHFHFSQAIWRKVQALGLTKAYADDPSVTTLVRQTVSLAFVPPTSVRLAWRGVKAAAPSATQGVAEFISYFEDTWLNGSFDVLQWNHHQNTGARTNNLKEAWHRKINNTLGKAHPNIYTFIDVIKQDEDMTGAALLQMSSGGQTRKRHKKWEKKDEGIRKLEDRLANRQLNLGQFLKLMQQFCGL